MKDGKNGSTGYMTRVVEQRSGQVHTYRHMTCLSPVSSTHTHFSALASHLPSQPRRAALARDVQAEHDRRPRRPDDQTTRFSAEKLLCVCLFTVPLTVPCVPIVNCQFSSNFRFEPRVIADARVGHRGCGGCLLCPIYRRRT